MPGADGHCSSFFARERGVDFKGVEGDFAQNGKVGGGFAGAGATGVLTHEDVEPPVQAVLDAPVGARQLGDRGGEAGGGGTRSAAWRRAKAGDAG